MQSRSEFLKRFIGRVLGLADSKHVHVVCTEVTSSECAFFSMPRIQDEVNELRFGSDVSMGLPLSDISGVALQRSV